MLASWDLLSGRVGGYPWTHDDLALSFVRVGIFMPNRTSALSSQVLNHWKVFLQAEQAKLFRPSSEQMKFIQKFLQGKDERLYLFFTILLCPSNP